ncbi:cytochrome P450 2D15-like isoform X2 [Dermochelys coriacea]|uniref:cytochrome P450 2D15-like isoform X2 n=1 Tax=Dermochelys coriacea TaxID=27794 RepID=UPI001CA81E57|nr:cytochrome P450 2D15-like isoform X2 [Dermochelys coriacea]
MELLLWLWSQLRSCGNNLPALGIALTVFALLFDFLKRRKSWSRYPPGPSSLPFLGTMLHIDFHNPHVSFTQLSKKYGDVFSLQNCWSNLIVVNGFKAVKEALVQKSEDFADRPYFPIYEHLGYGENSEGVVLARYGHAFKEQRRFALSTLRNFGMGKKSLEQRVTEEAGFLCSAICSEKDRPFDPHFLINNAVSNVICSLIYGERFDYDNKKFQRLLHLVEQALKEEGGFLPQLLVVVPWLLRIPGVPQSVFRSQKEVLDFTNELVKEHRMTWNPTQKRDFTDAFLQEIEKAKEHAGSSFNDNNLPMVTVDLFTAGTETTSTTLRWALLYMLLHPDIQCKVHEEIDKVIGRDRSPQMEDQANMPYTSAVIHETQRYGDIAPVGVPHMTYRDTDLQGFFIPKVVVFAWGNNWPGWSSFFSSPASCSTSPSVSLRARPGLKRMDTLPRHSPPNPTRSRLSQDKCSFLQSSSHIF